MKNCRYREMTGKGADETCRYWEMAGAAEQISCRHGDVEGLKSIRVATVKRWLGRPGKDREHGGRDRVHWCRRPRGAFWTSSGRQAG